MGIIFLLFCFFTILPFTTLLHELGHFFAAKLCNAQNITVRIGSGKEMLKFKSGDTLFVFHMLPFGGYTVYELLKPTDLNFLIVSLGGPLLNGFVALLLLFPGFGHGTHLITIWFQWLALFNLWMCVFNIIPFKLTSYYSDGWSVIIFLKGILK